MEESLLDQIRTVYTQSNHDARKRQKIQEQLRDLQRELYTDWELVFSISCGVSIFSKKKTHSFIYSFYMEIPLPLPFPHHVIFVF